MKEYNRELKRWVEPSEDTGSLKKRELCKGKKPHSFQLALPEHVKTTRELTLEDINEYYESEKRIKNYYEIEKELLLSHGIQCFRGWFTGHRLFICSVCGKKEYE